MFLPHDGVISHRNVSSSSVLYDVEDNEVSQKFTNVGQRYSNQLIN
jgi:hypothetical protein